MKKYIAPVLLLIALLALAGTAGAQHKKKEKKEEKVISIYDIDTLKNSIPLQRAHVHDQIHHELHRADASDGNGKENFIWFGEDTAASVVLTNAILRDMGHLDTMIENLPFADKQTEMQTKIGYLNALNRYLQEFNVDSKVDPYFYRRRSANFRNMLIACYENRVDEFVDTHLDVYTFLNMKLLLDDRKYPDAVNKVYTVMATQEPRMMIKRLKDYAGKPYADSVVKSAARIMPTEIYNYASSTDPVLGGVVRRNSDPLVQAIVRIARESTAPLKALPFLNDIYTGKLTIAQVDHITADEDLYYKNLVRLKLEQQNIAGDTYTDELAYRSLRYIRSINELHESPDAVRFKIINSLTPAELYFAMVYGQDEIYTSSFIKGTFRQMMDKMKPMPGDSLLAVVHYERFRTFIRMCANYSVLDEFLTTVQPDKKNEIMRNFMANLEAGPEDQLEDAVDVADAFGSIKDSSLANFLRAEVVANYKRVGDAKSKKGVIVYGLLASLFNGGADSLGLPPINLVPYSKLLGDTNIVFEQYFFYGDEDGRASYGSFLGNFKDGKWKIDASNKQWVKITSIAGKPIVIFANLPLEEPQDEEAQNALQKYLDQNEIHPTILIHRGHSYHLGSTIDHMTKYSKIVILGSCGGYHNLGTILDHSPDAQIISTKQTGAMAVNDPIIKYIHDQLLQGKEVNWVELWNRLDDYFKKQPVAVYKQWEEYVPPFKNLGAIFIKAYRKIYNATDDE